MLLADSAFTLLGKPHLSCPLTGVEMRGFWKLQREATSPFVFVSERGAQILAVGDSLAAMISTQGKCQ